MRFRTLVLATLTWLIACGPHPYAHAQKGASRRWAVIVGVEKYTDPAIPRLRFAGADASLVAETLMKHCGYDARDVLILSDRQEKAAQKPIRANLDQQIPDWLAKAEPGDTMLVYFSGHGFLDPRGESYLGPADCRREDIGRTGLRTDELRNQLALCKATRKLLVLDCCHAGAGRGEASGGASGQEVGSAFRDAQGLVTLASCRKAEESHEWLERGHGLFSFYVAEGLAGAADRDGDGVVDSDELYRYVFDQVTTAARKELNVRQTPVRFVGEDTIGVFPLARVASRVDRPIRPAMPAGIAPPSAPEIPGGGNGLRVRFEFVGSVGGSRSPAAFSPSGATLVTAGPTGPSGGMVAWDAKTRDEIAILKRPADPGGDAVFSVVLGFARDGKRLVSTSGAYGTDRSIDIWNVDGQKRLLHRGYEEKRGSDKYYHACFAPDGRLAYVRYLYDRANSDTRCFLMLWDMDTGKETSLLSDRKLERVRAMTALPDGKTLALADMDGNITFFDVAERRVRLSITGHAADVCALFCSPNGEILASNDSQESSLRFWNPATGKKVGTLKLDRDGNYQSVVFHPSGKFVATSSGPIPNANFQGMKPLDVWELASRKPLPIEGIDAIDPLAFSADGSTLAATTADGSGVGLWRVHLDDH